MDTKERKQQRIEEVNTLLKGFAREHLSPEISEYVFKLWAQIGRKRNYVITGGKKEIWASAVVYVIARLNFLFDKNSSNYLSSDTICGFFGTKKSTTSSKAANIEKVCKIKVGHEGFCSTEISDSLNFVELSNGMIVSKKQAKQMGLI